MIYYALVSLVPLLLLMLTGLGWLVRISPVVAAAQEDVLADIQATVGSDVSSTVDRLLRLLEQKSLIPLVVSLVGLLVTGSVLAHHLQVSFRAIWNVPALLTSGPPRIVVMKIVREKVRSFLLVIVGGGVLLVALSLVASVKWLMRYFGTEWALVVPSSLVILPLLFALLFRYVAPVPLRWRYAWVAGLLCGVVSLMATELLKLYGTHFGSRFNAYGAVGALLGAMLWMGTVSQCVFFGAELCKVLERDDAQRRSAGGSPHKGGADIADDVV
jgi:membrane protein